MAVQPSPIVPDVRADGWTFERPHRVPRWALLGPLFGLATGFVALAAARVPVRNLVVTPMLSGGSITLHWRLAVVSLVVVSAVDAGVLISRARRPSTSGTVGRIESGVPAPLRFQRVPRWALWVSAAASAALLVVTVTLGVPLWQKALGMLIPWIPVFAVEGVWRYRRYGFYAVFVGVAVLQVGHLGEHTAQVVQLLGSGGDLATSHGVFGALDFETVHFVWDTAVWIGGGILVYRYRHNGWVMLSWLAASVHQVEHVYLFWLNQLHTGFWARGGIAGIFGQGGLIGSPLGRPYLHFAYNFLVVVPMLIGLWDEARRIPART